MFAPRGIMAAAMASYFASQLRLHGLAGADRIEMLVFVTIGATVCVQGSWAALLARLLRVQQMEAEGVILAGVNEWSLAVAEELRSWGRTVLFVDNNPANCELARDQGFPFHQGDATDRCLYRQLDLSSMGVLVAMTPNDAVNTLVCDAASEWLLDSNILQIISKPTGDVPVPRVRMAGRWAMPTRHSYREIAQLLRQQRLYLETEPCNTPMTITPELLTSKGRMVPLLVMEAGRLRIAEVGQVCRSHALIIGLVALDPERGGEADPSKRSSLPHLAQAG